MQKNKFKSDKKLYGGIDTLFGLSLKNIEYFNEKFFGFYETEKLDYSDFSKIEWPSFESMKVINEAKMYIFFHFRFGFEQ